MRCRNLIFATVPMFERPLHFTAWYAAVTLVVGLPLAGCGSSDHGRVTGTLLRYDGAPLIGARVIAKSNDTGKSVTGVTDEEGRFELSAGDTRIGIEPGNYYVIIAEDRGPLDSRRPPSIAAKYTQPSQSKIVLDVKAGESTDLNLTLDPP